MKLKKVIHYTIQILSNLVLDKFLKQISSQAIALHPNSFSEAEKDKIWIGNLPASNAQIEIAENRLGLKLPDDILAFYKICNGSSIISTYTFNAFLPLENIGWMVNVDEEGIEKYVNKGEEFINELQNSIILAGIKQYNQVLLIPPYGNHTKWRYWEYASTSPGYNQFYKIVDYLERINDYLALQIKYNKELKNKF